MVLGVVPVTICVDTHGAWAMTCDLRGRKLVATHVGGFIQRPLPAFIRVAFAV